MTRSRAPWFMLIAPIASCALVLGGCSGSSSSSGGSTTTLPASGATTTSAPASGSTTSAAPADGGGGACGDVVAKVKAKLTNASVTGVQVTGACTIVSVMTSLTSDIATAQSLCDQASTLAYDAGSTGVSVYSASNREIATGVKGSPCIGEP